MNTITLVHVSDSGTTSTEVSQEQFEAQVALLTATHELRHAQGNACAFTLKAELSRTENERADNLGCVAYWDNQATIHQARVNELERIINRHY